MIKYNLKCHNNHEFESWFSNSNEFDKLKKKKLLDCIFCSSRKINKTIMAPMLNGIKENNSHIKMFNENLQKEKKKLESKIIKLIDKVGNVTNNTNNIIYRTHLGYTCSLKKINTFFPNAYFKFYKRFTKCTFVTRDTPYLGYCI